MAPIVHL